MRAKIHSPGCIRAIERADFEPGRLRLFIKVPTGTLRKRTRSSVIFENVGIGTIRFNPVIT